MNTRPFYSTQDLSENVASSLLGQDTKEIQENHYNYRPLISIITIVYNGEMILEQTIHSIINQTYKNIEYIIIDGGSTDATLEIIHKYEDRIHFWTSEPDQGIYDAMNKGIAIASGEWINFMNGGDHFATNTIVDDIFNNHEIHGDVLYGDVLFQNENKGEIYVRARSLDQFWKGMCFVHQSSFVRTSLMKQFYFNKTFKIAADYEFLFNLYMQKFKFIYINRPIARFAGGGLSDNNPKGILECVKIIKSTHNKYYHQLYYAYRLLRCSILYKTSSLIGSSNYAKLRHIKHGIKKIMGLDSMKK